jgi:hypothetical protein
VLLEWKEPGLGELHSSAGKHARSSLKFPASPFRNGGDAALEVVEKCGTSSEDWWLKRSLVAGSLVAGFWFSDRWINTIAGCSVVDYGSQNLGLVDVRGGVRGSNVRW